MGTGLKQFYLGQMFHWGIGDAALKRVRNQPYLTVHPRTGQPCIVWLMCVDEESMYGHVYYRPTAQFMDVFTDVEQARAEIDGLRTHCAAWAEGTLERHHGHLSMRMDAYEGSDFAIHELRDAGKMVPQPQPLVAQQIEAAVA